MEKNRILDASRNAVTLLLALTIFALASCSLPKIAILHDPLTPEEHINLGVAYEQKGELDAALQQYEIAAEKLALANLYVGNIYFQKNDAPNAERAYKRAIEKSNDARAYNNLAWLYYTRGERLDKAEELARKAVELNPESDDFRDTLEKIVRKRASSEGR